MAELTGRIEGDTLASLLQMFEQTRRTGTLTLQAQTAPRALSWSEGALVVRAGEPLLTTLICLMSEKKLSFEFVADEVDAGETVPLTSMLMDAVRTLDEWTLALAGLPPLDTVLEVSGEPALDAKVENAAQAFDGTRTLVAVALSLQLAPKEVGSLLRRAIAIERLKPFDPNSSGSGMFPAPSERSDSASRSSLAAVPTDPSRVTHLPRGTERHSSAPPPLRAGVRWLERWPWLVRWLPFLRVERRALPSPAGGTRASDQKTKAGTTARGQAGAPKKAPDGQGMPWERHEAALGDDAAEVLIRLPKALATEHKMLREVGDREFVERVLDCSTRALDLPMFPDAARRLDQMIRKGDPDLQGVVEVVRGDPDLARRMMQVASTAAHGRTPRDLDRAVARIGLDRVLRVVVSVFLQAPIFKVPGYEGQARIARRVSILAGELAAGTLDTSEGSESDYLAALLHEVGRLQILRLAVVRPGREAPSTAVVADITYRYQTSMATLMVARWGFSRDVEAAVARHPAPRPGCDGSARRVRIAQLGAHAVLSPGYSEKAFAAALAELGGGEPAALLAKARAVERAMAALGG